MKKQLKNPVDFYETLNKVAKVYGFKHMQDHLHDYPYSRSKCLKEKSCKLPLYENEKSHRNLLQWFLQNNLSQSKDNKFIVYHSNIDEHSIKCPCVSTQRGKNKRAKFTLTTIGIDSWTAEFFLIRTGLAMLDELGSNGSVVSLNSVGDKESLIRYIKVLKEYIKKKSKFMTPDLLNKCRQSKFMCDYYDYLVKNAGPEIIDRMPTSLRSLSDESKRHFQYVIEALEEQEIRYRIDNNIMGMDNINTHTLFSIDPEDGLEIKATGARYDTLPEMIFGQPIPIVSMQIASDYCTINSKPHKPKATKNKNTRIFLYHAGISSQKEAIKILEEFRRNNIPIQHKVYISRPTQQLPKEMEGEFSHVLRLGQEELQNSSIIVHRTRDNARKVIPLHKLMSVVRSI